VRAPDETYLQVHFGESAAVERLRNIASLPEHAEPMIPTRAGDGLLECGANHARRRRIKSSDMLKHSTAEVFPAAPRAVSV